MANVVGRLGKYRLLKRIAAGGMGEVYLAEDVKLQRRVAVKILSAHALADHEMRSRFEREANLAAKLQHPNIATIYEFDEQPLENADGAVVEKKIPYLAQEFIEGGTIAELLSGGPMETVRLVSLAEEIASGLAAAHAKGIVHRDLKPNNVKVTPEGTAKILDFGIAKLVQPEPAAAGPGKAGGPVLSTQQLESQTEAILTRPGEVLGTLLYMSPEQVQDEGIDHRSDMFSLGVILYRMATGELPFVGKDTVSIQLAIATQDPKPVRKVNPRVPPDLEKIINRCLAKDRNRRYPLTTDLLQDLRDLKLKVGPIPATVRVRAFPTGGGPRPAAIASTIFFGVAIALSAWWLAKTLDRPVAGGPPTGVSPPMLTPEAEARPSVAVLPFKMLGKAEDAYLAEGIGEEIASRLRSIRTIRVVADASARKYRNVDTSAVAEIAKDLGVDHVVLGQAQLVEGRIKVWAGIIRTRDGEHIWEYTFPPEGLAQLFELQEQVAADVAKQLNVQFAERVRLTDNPEAYRLYLEARSFLFTAVDPKRAAELLQKATKLDPAFAEAYALQARCLSLINLLQPSEVLRQQFYALCHLALEKKPGLAEALTARGFQEWVDGELEGARTDFVQALAQNPSDVDAQVHLGAVYQRVGLYERAFVEYEKARETDRSFVDTYWFMADAQYEQNKLPEAAENLERALKLNPRDWTSMVAYARLEIRRGNLEKAETHLKDADAFVGGTFWIQLARSAIHAARGERARALALLDQMTTFIDQVGPFAAYPAAVAAATAGDADRAIRYLELAGKNGVTNEIVLEREPAFDRIREDPRFKAIWAAWRTRRVALVEALSKPVEPPPR